MPLKTPNKGPLYFKNPGDGYFYTRISNPTIDILRRKIALLEGAEEGLAFGSGMAAIHAICTALTYQGSNIVAPYTIYGGTYRLFQEFMTRFGVEARLIDFMDYNLLEQSIDDKTSMVYLENPGQPNHNQFTTCKRYQTFANKGISRWL